MSGKVAPEPITGAKVRLRSKQMSDARDDYAWQKDPELTRLDAALPFTGSFARYLADYASEMNFSTPARRRFGVETLSGKHIGSCTYYDVDYDRGEAEIGILIGDRDYWNKGYGADAVNTLVNHVFTELNLRRIYLRTLEWNHRAQRCFQKCGFTACGRLEQDGYDFTRMELRREDWEKRRRSSVEQDHSATGMAGRPPEDTRSDAAAPPGSIP